MFDVKQYIQASIDTKNKILSDDNFINNIITIANVIVKAYSTHNKVLIAGNGGSAADAQHFAGELVSKFFFNRPGLAALALTTDTSILTAIGNDYGFDLSFARQVQANGNKGDVFVGISTSGNSVNVVNALKTAKEQGLITVGMVGEKPCDMDSLCDYIIKVPSSLTPTIQESHLMIYHILCAIVEQEIFGKQQ